MSAPKVSLYSLSDLKTTLDDHVPIYLTSPNLLSTSGPSLPKSLRFVQSHTATYIRLALGYTAVSIAAYLFYLDWYLKVPFSQHKKIAAPAALLYFLLNGALQAWIWFGERGIVFNGTRKEAGGRLMQLTIHSRQPHRKYDPVYRITVATGAIGRDQGKELELTVPFARFFAADGLFVPAAFETWLRESIPVLQVPGVSSVKGGAATAAVVTVTSIKGDAVAVPEQAEEEEDVVLVDSPSLAGSHAQASARDSAGSSSGGRKRPKKKI